MHSFVDKRAPPEAGRRVRVEGLSKWPHYNGLFARVERSLEGGRYRVVLEEQDAKVLSLKAHNLIPVDNLYAAAEARS